MSQLGWREALAKFCLAADWSGDEFEAACVVDPFWVSVKKHYSEHRQEAGPLVSKDNSLVRWLRKTR